MIIYPKLNSTTATIQKVWKSPLQGKECKSTLSLFDIQNHDGLNNGENLWTASGKLADEFDPKDAITIWFNEYKDYDFHTQVCAPGKKCGHYTQVKVTFLWL